MATASWNGQCIAVSDNTVLVEGNHYFPPEAVRREHLLESGHRTHCPWKGDASYFHVLVGGETNRNAAWCYPSPKAGASNIAGWIAFWHGVDVSP